MFNKNILQRFVRNFALKRVLVIGDIMVDRFIWGKVSRISPEAPVPVVRVERETFHLGGAGNVVNNLTALGARCALAGVIGSDSAGKEIKDELLNKGIDSRWILEIPDIPTIEKTRIIAASQQVVRVDREVVNGVSGAAADSVTRNIKTMLSDMDAVILSDYGKGVINSKMLKVVLRSARRLGIPVMVDPKVEHFHLYRGVTCITPNLKEAVEGMYFRSVKTQEDLEILGTRILKKLQSESVLITRGEYGMSLFEKGGRVTNIPTVAREVYDVTGAGDTVISVFTLSYICGATLAQSAYISNIAGGIVVGKLGTATTTREELIEWLKNTGN